MLWLVLGVVLIVSEIISLTLVLGMLGVVALVAAVRWPLGVLRRLDARARLQLALSVLAALAAVSLLKNTSRSSCPWDLAEFGEQPSHGRARGDPAQHEPAGQVGERGRGVADLRQLGRHL